MPDYTTEAGNETQEVLMRLHTEAPTRARPERRLDNLCFKLICFLQLLTNFVHQHRSANAAQAK